MKTKFTSKQLNAGDKLCERLVDACYNHAINDVVDSARDLLKVKVSKHAPITAAERARASKAIKQYTKAARELERAALQLDDLYDVVNSRLDLNEEC